ncbi:carboxylate-amine ligase [Paracoccus sediminis]|uniref:Putative glutamate--cysteine ligase 2 n=1 Tax=Paracoccus sediminis TaxID=1214787 RepID=A0A238UXE4_9RHOB|nr:carboxylate-amine ligase [Paracoccus sediminis]TBN52654.1 carboxylate-amine ligase [Paracoccus sediminis]SNR26922.1 carboxylate-amine ligase [Paracoccus sediminis]
MTDEPDFTLGIEEEYLLVDPDTGDLAPAPDGMIAACRDALGDQVSPEFLRCQIEAGTPVAADIAQARDRLAHLRRTVARIAGQYGLAPIAASCHPFADWRDQFHTDKDRYHQLSRDMGAVSRRMLICGMHVHVGIESQALRIDLMNQMAYFLPHLLALSASSPFWQGSDTGLASYRTTVFGGMPRTGLPPQFGGWDEFDRAVRTLTGLGVIEDSSKIWWDLRPSSKFPTLETRVCDASPRLDDTITLAALIQATLRMLWRLSRRNQRWRQYDPFLLGENRWRAARYGMAEGMIDFGAGRIIPFAQAVEDWLALIAPDADALDSQPQVSRTRDIVSEGGSAARQRAVLSRAMGAGATRDEAMIQLVGQLIADFHHGL